MNGLHLQKAIVGDSISNYHGTSGDSQWYVDIPHLWWKYPYRRTKTLRNALIVRRFLQSAFGGMRFPPPPPIKTPPQGGFLIGVCFWRD